MASFSDVPLLVGLALAWSLAATPGPANALIAQEAARRGWRAGWLTGLGAVTGDLLMFSLMWAGVLVLLARVPASDVVLAAAGAVLMAWFAVGAWRSARTPADAKEGTAAGGFAKCFLIVVTSPFNWVWWVSAGASMFSRLGLAVVAGFFLGLLTWVAFWSALARAGAARVKRFTEAVGYVSAVVLAVFAASLAWTALTRAWALLAA